MCIKVSKNSSLPDSLPILRLTELGELEKIVISLSYPWKLTNNGKVWKPTDNLSQTGWHDELPAYDVVDDNDRAILAESVVIFVSPLVEADNHLSNVVDVVNWVVDNVECERVDVTIETINRAVNDVECARGDVSSASVLFDTTPIKTIKDNHNVGEGKSSVVIVVEDMVDVVNGKVDDASLLRGVTNQDSNMNIARVDDLVEALSNNCMSSSPRVRLEKSENMNIIKSLHQPLDNHLAKNGRFVIDLTHYTLDA
ncbi:hypothetical protein K2173_015528 [Erythroxylum novogranatense]|uniref:Uncharacterized protein n=1 Tax=Erythroxylum novogranatense TaxID=1862640 RepID=A0AAV8SRV5_9ROSI|nr:hypothetical protein K2173_015528 [Erythroxylum novogranatense]